MKPQDIVVSTSGLQSHPNEYTVNDGSLLVAENVVLNRDGMAERRRGFNAYSTLLPDARVEQLFTNAKTDELYAHADNGIWYYSESLGGWRRKQGENNPSIGARLGVFVHGSIAYCTDFQYIYALDLETGKETLVAGNPYTTGTADGTGVEARFVDLNGITGRLDGSTLKLYVADGDRIREVTADGVVTTLAGSTAGFVDGTGASAQFNNPMQLVTNSDVSPTALLVADHANNAIRQVTFAGVVTTFAGSTTGVSGSTDATGTAARFWGPSGITRLGALFYVTDSANYTIRRITSGAVVTTFAGTAGVFGTADGTGAAARFTSLNNIGNAGGSLYASESGVIRKISSSAVVSTIGVVGAVESLDGPSPTFLSPLVGTADADGIALLVSEAYGRIRKLYLNNNFVATIAGAVTTPVAATTFNGYAGGVVVAPDDRRMRTLGYKGNIYITTNSGVMKSRSLTSTLQMAGIPKALPISATIAGGPPDILAVDESRGYRVVWGYREPDGSLVLGAPSDLLVVTNDSGSDGYAQLSFEIPSQIKRNFFYWVFATEIVGVGLAPGDEMGLIYEGNLVVSGLSPVQFYDQTPDAFRDVVRTPLYTNAAQETISNANNQPPLARDLVEFRDHVGYANITDKHTLKIQLLGTEEIASGDTIVIAGVEYEASASSGTTAGVFKVYSSALATSTGSQESDVAATAKEIVLAINSYKATTMVDAFYASGSDDIPGKIEIVERIVGGTGFDIDASTSDFKTSFSPPLSQQSQADRKEAVIRWSKVKEPEAVPLYRETQVGDDGDPIERVIALRDSVIVVKSRTIWRITGNVFEDFIATRLDDTTACAGRDSYAKLNNTVFGLSNQGFIAITDNAVQIVGRPEEHRVLAMLERFGFPNHDLYVATGAESQRLFVCTCLESSSPDSSVNFAYVYNAITRAWSRWSISGQCFSVLSDRIIWGTKWSNGQVLRQRSSRLDGEPFFNDYADETSTFTVTFSDNNGSVQGTWSPSVVYGLFGIDSIVPGWVLEQNGSQYLVVSATLNGNTWTLGLYNRERAYDGIEVGACDLYRSIPVSLEWMPRTAGSPNELKQFGGVVLSCETRDTHMVEVQYHNESDTKVDPVALEWVEDTGSDEIELRDFEINPGKVSPFRRLTTATDKPQTVGAQLSMTVSNNVARASLGVKTISVDVRPLESSRVNNSWRK